MTVKEQYKDDKKSPVDQKRESTVSLVSARQDRATALDPSPAWAVAAVAGRHHTTAAQTGRRTRTEGSTLMRCTAAGSVDRPIVPRSRPDGVDSSTKPVRGTSTRRWTQKPGSGTGSADIAAAGRKLRNRQWPDRTRLMRAAGPRAAAW